MRLWEAEGPVWRCLHNGLKTRDPQMWNDIIICCFTLHNEVSGEGWAWSAGVVHGETDPSDAHAFGQDPECVSHNPLSRLRDDRRAKEKRNMLMQNLKDRG